MNRRQFTFRGLLTLAVAALTGSAFKCSISKEKAVRVAGFVIDITKESPSLLDLLGAHDLAEMVRVKALPALEKLKDALASADISTARSLLGNVRSVLGSVGNALLNLPESPRRSTIIGILASVNVLLLTVEAFVESEVTVKPGVISASAVRSETGDKVLKVYEATRP